MWNRKELFVIGVFLRRKWVHRWFSTRQSAFVNLYKTGKLHSLLTWTPIMLDHKNVANFFCFWSLVSENSVARPSIVKLHGNFLMFNEMHTTKKLVSGWCYKRKKKSFHWRLIMRVVRRVCHYFKLSFEELLLGERVYKNPRQRPMFIHSGQQVTKYYASLLRASKKAETVAVSMTWLDTPSFKLLYSAHPRLGEDIQVSHDPASDSYYTFPAYRLPLAITNVTKLINISPRPNRDRSWAVLTLTSNNQPVHKLNGDFKHFGSIGTQVSKKTLLSRN